MVIEQLALFKGHELYLTTTRVLRDDMVWTCTDLLFILAKSSNWCCVRIDHLMWQTWGSIPQLDSFEVTTVGAAHLVDLMDIC